MNWTPKVGMKVRCIDDTDQQQWVTAHRVYEVLAVDDNEHGLALYITDNRGLGNFVSAWRFAPVIEFRTEGKLDTYATLGADIGRLVTEKQAAYGNSFGKAGDVMRILYPDGIPPEKMDDALTIVRILDKLFRIATAKDAFGESPYKDLVGYGLLGAAKAAK